MEKKILTGSISLIGLGLTALAFFANLFGLDRENNWGSGRTIVAGVGVALILISLLVITWRFWVKGIEQVKKLGQRLTDAFLRLPPVQNIFKGIQNRFNTWRTALIRLPAVRWYLTCLKPQILEVFIRIRNSRPIRYFTDSQDRMAALVAATLGILIIVVYVWFVSVGRWTAWPKTNTYYFQLAEAFRYGQTNLLVPTDPKLLSLADPYDIKNRENVAYIWDALFYKGKFYLYWGPAPALILAAIHFLYSKEIGDQVLVFAFVSGTFIFASMLVLRLRRRLFPNLGWPYIIPGTILAGLANPLPWLLNRPAIYEAAIAAGQFFLMAGLYFGFTAIEGRTPSAWRIALASACWALAMASRFTLAPAAFFLILMVAWWIYCRFDIGKARKYVYALLVFPFVAGLVGLGWYNQIRFGSWFEFGVGYQLTGVNVPAIGGQIFSIANFCYNLNAYLINPFRTLSIFPYVKPEWGAKFIFFPVAGSEFSNTEQVSGLIPTIPYVIFALIPIVFLLWRVLNVLIQMIKRRLPIKKSDEDGFFEWTTFTFSITFLLAFIPILLYMTVSMRYLADAVPVLIILSTVGFWKGAQFLERRSSWHGWFLLLVIVIMSLSAVISLLLAVTGYDARFEKLNPILFDHLTRMLTP